MIKKRIETEKLAEANKHATSIPTLPDHLKDLLTLDLSGVGQGDDALGVDGQCIIVDTGQDKSCVVVRKKADTRGQLETENDATGTTNLSQDGSMGLLPKTPLFTKDRLTTTRPQSRVDALNASIARCQAKLSVVSGSAKEALFGLVQRLNDELQSLACDC